MTSYAKMSFLNKKLKGSFNASLNGQPFRLNPMTISLDYTVKTSQTPTINGMVVQIFGVEMGDLTVTGSFGKGGWQEQVKFLDEMLALGNAQASPLGVHNASPPFRFLYPQRNYDFLVYLKEYGSASGLAVDYQNENFAPDWKLTLFVDNDNTNGGLVTAATNAYIERLNAGFGYAPNKYMGIIHASDVESFLSSQGFSNNIQGYINAAFADPSLSINPVATGNNTSTAPAPTGGTSTTLTPTLIAYILQLNGGDSTSAQDMQNIIATESSGNSTVTNSIGAFGIAQALNHGTSATEGTLSNAYGGFGITTAQAISANSGNAEAQLLWMYNYMVQKYGSVAAAWSYHIANGNY